MKASSATSFWPKNEPDDGYRRLARAIIAKAADALARAVYTVGIVDILSVEGPHLRNMMTHYHGAYGAVAENEYFFRSDWYYELAKNSGFNLEGEEAIAACHKKAEEWIREDLQLDLKHLQKKYTSHRFYRYK